MNIKNYIDTEELKFTVEFITPCFLGGATGNAEIRTAPFKNLIRRWWRIVNGNLSPEELWQKEAELFGSTEKNPKLGKSFGKSKVVVEIIEDESKYSYQRNNQLRFPEKTIKHPEVSRPMSFETYLGMGPIFWNKEKKITEYKFFPINEFIPEIRNINPKTRQEIVSDASGYISMILRIPENERDSFIKILTYINYFGSIGSRSRNGWGSININPLSDFNLLKPKDIKESSVLWNNLIDVSCDKKYPSAIARDEMGLLCWGTPQRNTWEEAMYDAAKIYCALRTSFKFTGDSKVMSSRHLLGYPITHHEYDRWPVKNTRLPSQLYIKINMNQGKYRALITHIPNLIPLDGFTVEKQQTIWTKVHNFLDNYEIEEKKISRFGGAK